ncbi:Retrovirus-related Pol polyprotein from transposon TNT 1-94 [Cucumis melo var. makuwa]|uniref:Retrovirus-related Pol polyprotein from transposon TNT 1-94 n=1 Tax=Cucumis melo var. makuwa TaxID=1194695 RepID=A0A5D3BYG1_CUCMM|nr:Retrovirus-related Pol polyprotein from transposon TNT 1-94 [Cucumis melo var. makuwa]
MVEAKAVSTPLEQHFKLSSKDSSKDIEESKRMESIPYSNATGSLMYLIVCTRPDLAHYSSIVSRYMGNPGRAHWEATKWVFLYLKGLSNRGLLYKHLKSIELNLYGYVDSDYAGDLDKRRSLIGFTFVLGGNVISWKSNLQPVVTLSTLEAESIAMTEAVKETIWLKGILEELGFYQRSINITCHSQNAIHLSKNQQFHERTKHIDVKLHFIREMIEKRTVKITKYRQKIMR